jgi:hypothetical protein
MVKYLRIQGTINVPILIIYAKKISILHYLTVVVMPLNCIQELPSSIVDLVTGDPD